MRTITIELTEEQEKFLKEFALKQGPNSKDNVCTDRPIHLVQTQRERVVDPAFDEPDATKYVLPDRDYAEYASAEELVKAFYEDKDCPISIVSFDEAYQMDRCIDIHGEEQVIVDEDDYLEAYGITKEKYYKVNIGYYYDAVAVFFILDRAKEYLKYQSHNLEKPRTYTIGAGYANKGEYHHFWGL